MGRRWRKDRGAALITVLAMLSIMSMLAVVAMDSALMGVRRTQNQAQLGRARWYLTGAEAFAAGRLKDIQPSDIEKRVDASEWQGKTFNFPLDEGAMTITLFDGSNCFNLNSLVSADENGIPTVNAVAQVRFAQLLDLANVRSENTTRLAASVVDWIDPDQTPGPGGAEDESYGGPEAPYRVANTLMADLAELTRVRGFTPKVMEAILPYVCVRPTEAVNLLNPNTLTPDQAILLAIMVGPQMSLQAAEAIIRSRPRGGWPSVAAFLSQSGMAQVELSEATRAAFDVKSNYFVAVMSVQYRDTQETGAVLLSAGNPARVLRRVYGAGGRERLL